MIKRQIERIKEKLKHQSNLVFSSERKFNESIANEFGVDNDSIWWEPIMLIITHVMRRLNQVRQTAGDDAVWDILSDGKSDKFIH